MKTTATPVHRFYVARESPLRRKAINWDKTESIIPSHLLDHFPDEIGNLLVHAAVFVRIREALSSELLFDGVEGFVEVVAVIWTGRPGSRCRGGRGVHGYGERDRIGGIGLVLDLAGCFEGCSDGLV